MNTENGVNIIERYLQEVARHLPRKHEKDILDEIRSSIMDSLDDGNQDESDVLDILESYGDPRLLAGSYSQDRYLIGPSLFPYFRYAVYIILIIFLVTAIANLVQMGIGSDAFNLFAQRSGYYFLELIDELMSNFGIIVFIFAMIELIMRPNVKKKSTWKSTDLLQQKEVNKRKHSDNIIQALFILLFLVILNFFPYKIGFFNQYEGRWMFFPVLNEAFFAYLPWINVYLVVKLVIQIILIRGRDWSNLGTWMDVILTAFGIGILFSLMNSPHIWGAYEPYYMLSGWQTMPDIEGKFVELGFEGLGILLHKLVFGLMIFGAFVKLVLSSINLVKTFKQPL